MRARYADVPTAGDIIRGGDIVCHLGERLGDAMARVRAAGKDASIVVDDHHIVLGRVRGKALESDPNAKVEDLMRSGPSTIRPDTSLEAVVKMLSDGGVKSTLVTDQSGRFMGTAYLEDAQRKLAEHAND